MNLPCAGRNGEKGIDCCDPGDLGVHGVLCPAFYRERIAALGKDKDRWSLAFQERLAALEAELKSTTEGYYLMKASHQACEAENKRLRGKGWKEVLLVAQGIEGAMAADDETALLWVKRLRKAAALAGRKDTP